MEAIGDYGEFETYVNGQWPVTKREVDAYWRERYRNEPKFLAQMEANYRKEYEKETAKRDKVFVTAHRFDDYPAEVRALFLNTARMMVVAEERKRIEAKQEEEKFTAEYEKDILDRFYIPYWQNPRWMRNEDILKVMNPLRTRYLSLKDKTDEDLVALFHRIVQVREYRAAADKSLMPSEAIALWAEKLADIDALIRERMGGVPDGFERETGWGVGGYYNGILVRNGLRVSFKSFWAGGWNIQRAHIRVRLTALKEKKAKRVRKVIATNDSYDENRGEGFQP